MQYFVLLPSCLSCQKPSDASALKNIWHLLFHLIFPHNWLCIFFVFYFMKLVGHQDHQTRKRISVLVESIVILKSVSCGNVVQSCTQNPNLHKIDYVVLIHVLQEQQRRWDDAPFLLLLLPCAHWIPLTPLYSCLIFCYFDFRHADQVCFSTISQFWWYYSSVYYYLCWPSVMLFISSLSPFHISASRKRM